MGTKIDIIGKADYNVKPDDIDVDRAWADAKAYLVKIGVPAGSGDKPDVKKIRAAMAATKKPLTFVVKFDGNEGVDVMAVVNGKTVEPIFSANISEGGDQDKWRIALGKMVQAGGKLFTSGELAAWDKKHPDPDAVKQLEAAKDNADKEAKILELQIRRLLADLKPLQDKLAEKKKKIDGITAGLKALGVDVK